MSKEEDFRHIIWQFYKENGRKFSWRETYDAYAIFVSELMLQQTQTFRVVPKYEVFLSTFPTLKSVADATLADVLTLWNGLGYNRRAKYFWETARILTKQGLATLPNNDKQLQLLPGIGPYTAAALRAFAYNEPTIFLETNIRTVIIHFFFQKGMDITDTQILTKVALTLDKYNPRAWYYALMDYGAYLKGKGITYAKQLHGYAKQSIFRGSDRFVRGQILKILIGKHHIFLSEQEFPGYTAKRVNNIASKMSKEGLIQKRRDILSLPKHT